MEYTAPCPGCGGMATWRNVGQDIISAYAIDCPTCDEQEARHE